MLTATFHEFPIPTAGAFPFGIVAGPDGNLWFAESNSNQIGRITPAGVITEFATSGGGPTGITGGSDGNVWFTEGNGKGQIGRITPSGTTTLFPVPTQFPGLIGITLGPDGNLWFTEGLGAANKIGRITPGGMVTEFPIPTPDSNPFGIVSGPDGALWFTETFHNIKGQVDKIGRITTSGTITEFTIPTVNAVPTAITTGPDGNLWFDEAVANRIGRITPTGTFTEFPLPATGAVFAGITVGADGNLYFGGVNSIGQITPTGTVTEFPITAQVEGITKGPDGNIWFTDATGNFIDQLVLTAPPTAPDLAVPANAPGSVTLGSNVTYTFTVTNNGTAGATGVTLTDTLPAGVSFVSATGGVTPASGVLTFTVGNLAAGASGSFTIVVTPTAAGTLSNQASVSGNQSDPTPADNSVTRTTTVSSATAPDLALSVDAAGSVTLGSNVTYTLTVTNNGTAVATGVTLTDTLPAGVTFVSATGGVTPASGALTFTVGNLAAGASASFTIVVTPTAAGTLNDRASVGGNETDPTPADNSVTQNTTVAPAGVPGPTVTGVQRFGFHERPTTLVLTFDKPLDPARAQYLGNYQIFALSGCRRTIRIKKAVYDSATRTVTLSPVHLLNLHHRFRLTVVGTGPSGVTDISGNPLDGQKTGDPGSNFVTIVTARDLVLTAAERG